MHDISDNKYLDNSNVTLQEYSVRNFLRAGCALEKRKEMPEIYLTIAKLLSLLKFDFKLIGYNYLIMLVAHYLVKHDYTEVEAIKSIAHVCGTTPQVIDDNIHAVIKYNSTFLKIATCALPVKINIKNTPTVAEVLEIIGAIYKMYYNYTTDSEIFDEEKNPAVDFNRIVFKSGK